MGLGDNLMATGMARGAAARGKRIAFGDGRRIIWDTNSELIFRGNPNIAAPYHYMDKDLEWIGFHRGNRIYNKQSGNRWIWNYEFCARPGEMFFSDNERKLGELAGRGFVVMEPNVPAFKACAPNKQWPPERYNAVAKALQGDGYEVVQMVHGPGRMVAGARPIQSPNFRVGLSILSRAALYIGPEGGLHHGAAAVGVPAVVLFGGFIPPEITGYASHTNLTGGAEACGMLAPCGHCRAAMAAITVDQVVAAAGALLELGAPVE